jgi:hypothetical protein
MRNKIRLVFAVILAAILASPGIRPAFAQEEPHHLYVLVDIKPGSYPNPINLGSRGTVPVALLGDAGFDVACVDTATVKFGQMHESDSGAAPQRFASEDVNGDGFMDIVFHFRVMETGLLLTDREACLHGMLQDGTHFCGHDTIVIIP